MSIVDTPLHDCDLAQVEQIISQLKEWTPSPSELVQLRAWWVAACTPPHIPAALDVAEPLFKHLGWDAQRILLDNMSAGRVWQRLGQYSKHYDLGNFWLAHAIKDGEHEIARRLATDTVKNEDERANLVISLDRRLKVWGHVRLNQATIDVLNECMPHLIWGMTNSLVNTINDGCVCVEQIRSNPDQDLTSGPRLLQNAKADALKKILAPAVFFSNASKQGFVEEYLFNELRQADRCIEVWLDRMPEQIKTSFHKTMQQLLADEELSPIVRQGAPIAVSLHENFEMSQAMDNSGAPNQAKKL